MKKNKIIILTLLILPILIAIGYSTWMIINDVLLNPYESKDSLFYVELNDQEVEYTGAPQLPSSTNLVLSDDNITYKYRKIGEPTSSWTVGAPTDAGEYYIYFETKDKSIKSSDVRFTIKRKKVLVNTVEIKYSEVYSSSNDYRTWNEFYKLINNKISFSDLDGNYLSIKDIPINYYLGDELSNGSSMCTYNDSNSSSKVFGSTYNINLEFYGSSYGNIEYCNSIMYNNDVNSTFYTDDIDIIVKYQTALTTIDGISDSYCTIEDAILLGTGNITLCGDATTADSYVGTSFCNLLNNNPYIYYSNYEKIKYREENTLVNKLSIIMENRTLYVPYNNTTTVYDTKETGANVYSALIIPNNVIMNSYKSTINVGASIGYAQPKTTTVNDRGVLVIDGILNLGENTNQDIDNSSKIFAYGYIKSSSEDSKGAIHSYESSEIQDCMTTYDWPGGSTITTLLGDNKAKFLPLNAWTFHNNSCKTYIHSSSIYKGYLFADISADIEGLFYIVTPSTHSNASETLFKATGAETDYIIKQAKPAKSWAAGTDNYKKLYAITGSNQVAGQRDQIDVYGTYEDSEFEISVKNYPMSTGTDKACSLGYMDINIHSISSLKLNKSDFLLLPGSTIRVDGSLEVGKDVDLIFENITNIEKAYNDSNSKGFAFGNPDKCIDKEKAKLILNGSLTLKGNLSGYITTEMENVTLTFDSNSNLTTSYLSLFDAYGSMKEGDVAYKVTGLPAYGNINNSTSLGAFSKSTYVSKADANGFYWEGTVNSSITNYDGTYTKSGWTKKNCITSGSLLTLADGTQKKVEDLLDTDLLLVFNHETGQFEEAPLIFVDRDEWTNYNVVNLEFSNGEITRLIYEHGYFNNTLNKYVYITEDNYQEYIGHEFTFYNGNELERATLVNSYITNEYVGCYSPVTAYHLNYFVDGFLSMPGGITGLFNIFEYNDDMTYDIEKMNEDIAKYGLYTYEDFKDYLPYEVYLAFPGPYLKVSVGKGYVTFEEILAYIEQYLGRHGLDK